MTLTRQPWRKGVPHSSGIVSNVAAATPVLLYTISPSRSCLVRKIWARNNNAAASVVQIGTGLGGLFVALFPPFLVVNGMETQLPEDLIPEAEAFANLTMQASVAGAAPADVQVQVEVEEFIGTTG